MFPRGRSLRRNPRQAVVVLILLVILAIIRYASNPETPPEMPAEGMTVQVERVVDGDTLLVTGHRRVRLLGVDTPETKHPKIPPQPFGKEASEFTTQMVEGKTVRLEFDRERYDQYQRILAYVYVGDVFLNEELILQGLSPAETQYPYRSDMKRRFRHAEEAARRQRLGIWSSEASTIGH